ncbi:hypothetical protein BZA05DRAFT_473272 [Tricharina praecox]|uniref:uncharacterized protein n=1 Tax=Tricharina praecox TaxID=43433 RepID=UPI00221E72E8|nr:uncharacterized protein BZA05DRAFT_473272 [Tricharina praecox]KAI5853925.1 hypothetical protein BZA05DRAFT_473272 [Tricharina praecox]
MANMPCARSVLYTMKLSMVSVFNRTDTHDSVGAKEWMLDFGALNAVLMAGEERAVDICDHCSTLCRSCSMSFTTVALSLLVSVP